MTTSTNLLLVLEPLLSILALVVLVRTRQVRRFLPLAGLLAVKALSDAILFFLLRAHLPHLGGYRTYLVYFSVYWTSYAIEALLAFGTIVSIYRMAMEPLEGLQKLGMLMFYWAGAISVVIAVTIGFGPHVSSFSFIIRCVMQLQQAQSVITLCMLLFVCFAIRPMGLSYRSRIFGVSLGLGIIAMVDLVQAAWTAHAPRIVSLFSTISGLSICISLLIWTVYLVLPEPQRALILLPTTSPFFHWNRISEVLGDAPGFVALGGMSDEMFAPAEVEMMHRASAKMAERKLTPSPAATGSIFSAVSA